MRRSTNENIAQQSAVSRDRVSVVAGDGGSRQQHVVLVMRRLVGVAAVLLLPAAQVQAQTVFCTNCADEITSIAHQVQVLAQWAQQIQAMRLQYEQLVMTYQSISHLNPGSLQMAAGLLNNASRLPGSEPAAIPGLNYGQGLSGAGQPFYDQNHYYTPQGNDWEVQEMQRREYATANLQGEAQTGITTIRQRLAGLDELQASIPTQPDVQATAAINARIASEKAYLSNETNHIQNLAMLQQTQAHVDQQRAEQYSRQSADNAAAAWK